MSLEEEEQREKENSCLIISAHKPAVEHKSRLLNSIPLHSVESLRGSNSSFIQSSRFPTLYFHVVDQKFATLLGFTVARMIALPMSRFTMNVIELDSLVRQLNHSKIPSRSILFYRYIYIFIFL